MVNSSNQEKCSVCGELLLSTGVCSNMYCNSNNIDYYFLMNKDTIVAKFHLEPIILNPIIDNILIQLPTWMKDLSTFIINRQPPNNRENIELLLEASGIKDLRGYLDITHALSLVDTFWVKRSDSKLQWGDVSLFRHKFSEAVAHTAFEGGLHGRQLDTTSPEYGTDGSFAKCWIRENGVIRMIKRGSTGARNAGLEPYSEFYASQIISRITNEYVEYDLRSRDVRVHSVCDCFTSEDVGFVPYAALYPENTTGAKVISTLASHGLEKEAKTMFVVDAVIMNEDRHKNNFGFLINNDTLEIIGFAPLFDHNISLLPYAEKEDFDNIDNYLSLKGPRLDRYWNPIAIYSMTPEIRKSLVNMKDFKFIRHPKYNLPEWRLEHLEKLIQQNIENILAGKK